MIVDPQTLMPLAGGGLLGFGVGYLLKKLLKIGIIVIGAIALLIGYLEYQKWISVNWLVVEHETSNMMAQAAHKAAVVTQNMGHEIPIGLGVIGFIPAALLGFAKG